MIINSGQVTQESLDATQYSTESILRYESVYGEDFVSPGGHEMAAELIGELGLEPGSRVLDVGCGLGGSAFVMAQDYDLIVEGIDLSMNMLEMANSKCLAYGLGDRVTLEHGDCLEIDRSEFCHGIYSRDVFLHIRDKARLFSVLLYSLRPGGKLLFTDYCCGDRPWSEEFSGYVKGRGYILHSLPEYAELVAAAGFSDVASHDITGKFIDILRADLGTIADLDISEPIRNELQQSWNKKLTRSISGDHKWGLFTAVRPG